MLHMIYKRKRMFSLSNLKQLYSRKISIAEYTDGVLMSHYDTIRRSLKYAHRSRARVAWEFFRIASLTSVAPFTNMV